jgi:His-Xaa-Ser system protein HxsD
LDERCKAQSLSTAAGIVERRTNRVIVAVDTTLFSEAEAYKAAYWFSDRLFVAISREGGQLTASFSSKPGTVLPLNLEEHFENALIEEKVRSVVRQETADLRKAIFRAAFPEIPTPS